MRNCGHCDACKQNDSDMNQDVADAENEEGQPNRITAEVGPPKHGLSSNEDPRIGEFDGGIENEEDDMRPGINTCEYSTATRKRHCGECTYCRETGGAEDHGRFEHEEFMNKPSTSHYMGEENNEDKLLIEILALHH